MRVIKLVSLPVGEDSCIGCLYSLDLDKCSTQVEDCSGKQWKEVNVDPCANCGSTNWAAKNPLYCTCCEHEYAAKHTKPVKVGH